MAVIRFNTQHLAQQAQTMHQGHTDIHRHRERLTLGLQRQITTNWRGQARDSFAGAHRTWTAEIVTSADQMADAARLVSSIGQNWDDVEQALVHRFGG